MTSEQEETITEETPAEMPEVLEPEIKKSYKGASKMPNINVKVVNTVERVGYQCVSNVMHDGITYTNEIPTSLFTQAQLDQLISNGSIKLVTFSEEV
ncbi:MAG: hypothetical protein NTV01_01785 [Bacteroidia bacterium]|nr:hypothetical protein [Bacteroidia bacterium]